MLTSSWNPVSLPANSAMSSTVSVTFCWSFSSCSSAPAAPFPSLMSWVICSTLARDRSSLASVSLSDDTVPCTSSWFSPTIFFTLATTSFTSVEMVSMFWTMRCTDARSFSVTLRTSPDTASTFARIWSRRVAFSRTVFSTASVSFTRFWTIDSIEPCPWLPPSTARSDAVTAWMSAVIVASELKICSMPCASMTRVISPSSSSSGWSSVPGERSSM